MVPGATTHSFRKLSRRSPHCFLSNPTDNKADTEERQTYISTMAETYPPKARKWLTMFIWA